MLRIFVARPSCSSATLNKAAAVGRRGSDDHGEGLEYDADDTNDADDADDEDDGDDNDDDDNDDGKEAISTAKGDSPNSHFAIARDP